MKTKPLDLENASGRAIISPDGKYRYTLERAWAALPRYILWIMLNPSTADASTNDATIRRCLGYARAWGYTGILVGNLYAYRATHPVDLERAHTGRALAVPNDATLEDGDHITVGPENDQHLRGLIRRASLVVCAWGKPGPTVARRWQVMRLIRDAGADAHVLKFNMPATNFQREPAHPLRLGKDLSPIPWDMFPNAGPGAGA